MITDLQLTKNKRRVNIFVDGEFAFALDKEVAISAGLHKGSELNEKQINKLKESDSFQRCLDAALNFLSYRPRSENEIKLRLRRRGFTHDMIGKTTIKLRKQGLINDMEFVKYWIDNRSTFNPKSRSLLKIELRKKGINNELINNVLSGVNDEENAYRAAKKKARILGSLEFEEFRAKLFSYLKWRGFGYSAMENVCNRIWDEKKTEVC